MLVNHQATCAFDDERELHALANHGLARLAFCLASVFLAAFFPSTVHANQPEARQIAVDILQDDIVQSQSIDNLSDDQLNWRKANRVEVDVKTGQAWLRLPKLDPGAVLEFSRGAQKITLFERNVGANEWNQSSQGERVPLSQSAMPVAEMAFQLSNTAPDEVERFVLIEQPTNVIYTIDVWDAPAFKASSQNRLLLRLFLLGVCIAMIAFNVVVSLITRRSIFFLNAAMIASLVPMGFVIEGTGAFLFWPENPELTRPVLIVSRAASALFSALFVAALLSNGPLPRNVLKAARLAGLAICLAFLSVLLTADATTYIVMILASGVLMLAQFGLIIAAVVLGDRRALLYLIPTGVLFIGLSFRWATMLFSIDEPFLRYHTLELTLAFEALAFSLILANRIRFYAAEAAQARAELSEMSLLGAQKFAAMQDNYRAQVASALHDSVGQSLAMVSGQLRSITKRCDDLDERLDYAQAALAEAVQETRQISHELHPARLEHLGLKICLEDLADNMQKSCGVEIKTRFDFEDDVLNPDQAMQIYRIAQEGMSNIARHSQAKSGELSLTVKSGVARFSLSDNGVGLTSVPDEASGAGLGLFSMRQRAKLLGTQLQIDSPDSGGLTLRFKLELEQRE